MRSPLVTSTRANPDVVKWRQTLRRQFPNGFLPEEWLAIPNALVDEKLFQWPWRDGAEHDSFTPIQHSTETLGATPSEIKSRLALWTLERELAEGVDGASLVERWDEWRRRHLTEAGLYGPAPDRTFAVLPSIYRIILGLGAKANPTLDGVLRTTFAASMHSLAVNRVRHRDDGPISPGYLGLVAELVQRRDLKEWSEPIRWLFDAPVGSRPAAAPRKLPPFGLQSDQAGWAILRRDWSARSSFLSVEHRPRPYRASLWVAGEKVWDDDDRLSIVADGKTVQGQGSWECTCWFDDEDGQYLELRRVWGGGIVVERQFYAARDPSFLFMCDTIKSARKERLEVARGWTVPGLVELRGALPTTARDVVGLATPLRLYPLGHPSDPMTPARGQLISSADGVTLKADSSSGRCHLPMIVGWRDVATAAPRAWRRLTITNDRRVVSEAEAFAYRWPVLEQQFVFFKQLGATTRCAFLGHQTFSEAVIGEFTKKGTVREWVSVE